MTFFTAADAYDRFMGRYSILLAPQLLDLAVVRPGQTALDVGCGPGALTTELVARLGADHVTAVDPSTAFVAAVRERLPGTSVLEGSAEHLPFADQSFDVALAQLVVHFMTDPVAGLAEMRRVTRLGGVVAACVWDHAGGQGPLGVFWTAARELDANALDESHLAGVRKGHLGELLRAAGLRDIEESALTVEREHAGFDEWWTPFEEGVGPAGAYVATLSPEQRAALRDRCRAALPDGPFVLRAVAWACRARV